MIFLYTHSKYNATYVIKDKIKNENPNGQHILQSWDKYYTLIMILNRMWEYLRKLHGWMAVSYRVERGKTAEEHL